MLKIYTELNSDILIVKLIIVSIHTFQNIFFFSLIFEGRYYHDFEIQLCVLPVFFYVYKIETTNNGLINSIDIKK